MDAMKDNPAALTKSVALSLVSLLMIGMFVFGVPTLARASPCVGEWVTKSATDDSFSWSGNGLSASWSGKVIVREFIDRNCNTAIVQINYAGSPSTGTIGLGGLSGISPFVSFTVQSQPFTDYSHVADHEIGTLYSWTPAAGTYNGYNIEAFTSPYAEYVAESTNSAQKTIPGVFVAVRLPLSYLGATVYGEVFVGFNLYAKYNALYIPP